MGTGRARRGRGNVLSLGRRGAGDSSELRIALEEWARTGWEIRSERLRTFRYRGQRSRVVRGLVCSGLLFGFAGAKSARAGRGQTTRVARWFVAALYKGLAVRGAIEYSSGIPVRGLRLSYRARYRVSALPRCSTNRAILAGVRGEKKE